MEKGRSSDENEMIGSMRKKDRRDKKNTFGREREERKPAYVYTAQYKVKNSCQLLEFLLEKCNTSRNNVKSLLSERKVLVNGSPVTQYNFMLAREDEVKISKTPVNRAVQKQMAKPVRRAPKNAVKIIYEDDDFIAIDKPAGLLSVESDKDPESAFSYVLNYLQSKDKALRPFIVHRIDKETSGVLIFTTNVKLHSILRLHWNEYVKRREYYAVVEGKFDKKEDTIVSYLKENKNNLMYSTADPSGQKAVTNYKVTGESGDYSLLQVKIDTGRKNQIRVHMHEAGHPVVGDDKYGCQKNPLKRLGLHASKLEFEHPLTHRLISVYSPVPAPFRALVAAKKE